MTIFFVTAHDDATNANRVMANYVCKPHDLQLYEISAVRSSLLNALTDGSHSTAFLMSHGKPYGIVGNDNIFAINENDGSTLANFKVFAWACWTGSRLGHYISLQGGIWWGYDCRVTAPDERPKFAKIMAPFFQTAKDNFGNGIDAHSILTILNQIQSKCIQALNDLDAIDAHLDEDGFSLYSCCNQFWERLSVWMVGMDMPFRHPAAPPPFIDL